MQAIMSGISNFRPTYVNLLRKALCVVVINIVVKVEKHLVKEMQYMFFLFFDGTQLSVE